MSWLTLALLTAGCTRNTSDDSGNGALDSSGPTLLEACLLYTSDAADE